MNDVVVKKNRKHRRGQSGQSIIVLAIGFIALLGFVGIVTDVSLLFVRYSSLSRAVDAAAVSAAGQMRRVADDASNNNDGEAVSVAQLQLAARQFIDAYGIDTTTVLVETCRVQVLRDTNGVPIDLTGVPLYNSDGSDNSTADADDRERYEQLCTEDELKLVRVTAQIDAPTTFLYLLGYRTVRLSVEAISQTAVLDVVLVLDVSESMINETTYTTWENAGYGYRYLPRTRISVSQPSATNPDAREECWNWALMNTMTQEQLFTNGLTVQAKPLDPVTFDVMTDPITGEDLPLESYNCPGSLYQPYAWLPTVLDADSPTVQAQPEFELCQTRLYPRTTAYTVQVPSWLRTEYTGTQPGQPFPTDAEYASYFPGVTSFSSGVFEGFVPTYNFHGCCNDPNGDFNFEDLICQPFRSARDAALGFLERLDFLRGDRVAYVTFDRSAFIYDPDGDGPQIPMIETQNDLFDGTGNLIRRGAEEVLVQNIGVRTEPNFYLDIDQNGVWDCLRLRPDGRDPDNPSADTTSDNGCYTMREINGLDPITPSAQPLTIESIQYQPVSGACPLDSISLDANHSALIRYRYDEASNLLVQRSTDQNLSDTPLDDITTRSSPVTMPAWAVTRASAVTGFRPRLLSYEFVASCGGTNIGGALSNASNMLYFNGRREGAVWLMVLLSDGAAGVSDPFRRTIVTDQVARQPSAFSISPSARNYTGPTEEVYVTGSYRVIEPEEGEYGAFGLCPYGTELSPSELTDDTNFPQCSDTDPASRTFCGDPEVASPPNLQPLIHPTNPAWNCEDFYNVDDYARDWADWVAIADLNVDAATAAASGRVQDQLLPAIYTIGFGLDFEADYTLTAGRNCTGLTVGSNDYNNCIRGLPPYEQWEVRRADYLGEELLRYIADAGDNFRIDSDYWQGVLGDRIGNGIDLSEPQPNWGPRGPCEIPVEDLGAASRADHNPIAPNTSCGNYFAAGTPEELTRVFNEIASRLFTRISQ
jgi:hypothetical protein